MRSSCVGKLHTFPFNELDTRDEEETENPKDKTAICMEEYLRIKQLETNILTDFSRDTGILKGRRG